MGMALQVDEVSQAAFIAHVHPTPQSPLRPALVGTTCHGPRVQMAVARHGIARLISAAFYREFGN